VAKQPYVAPAIKPVGTLSELTLTNKFVTTSPDGVVFHPPGGGSINLGS
jgi:hypothetical protein